MPQSSAQESASQVAAPDPPLWRVAGCSVRGAAHVRANLPNQDAIHWLPRSQKGLPLILAVSDGHGSSKSFRSDVGSRLAVTKTAWLIQDLLDGQPDPDNLSAIKRTAEERLPREIVRRWRAAVDEHLREHPFTPDELKRVMEARGALEKDKIVENPYLAYGATILTLLATHDFFLFLQLGDGDILTVMEDGEVLRPMPRDSRLFANETTSLCMDEAWHEMRCHFEARYGPSPAMVLLTTDGYANSFVNDAAFLQVGRDLLTLAQEQGMRSVKANMPSWLQEASESGSGDDITLGVIYRCDAVPESVARPAASSALPAPEADVTDEQGDAAGSPADAAGSPADAAEQPADASNTDSPTATASSAGSADSPLTDDGAAGKRARRVASIKQEGPSEPAKQLTPDVTSAQLDVPVKGDEDGGDDAEGSETPLDA